ncbi:MAG: RHS repeat-associated core domain-containing protein, partial [Ktedonobacteraceae bacterium]
LILIVAMLAQSCGIAAAAAISSMPQLARFSSRQPDHGPHDALGSTLALTDTVGNVTDTYQYDDWGNLTKRTGTTYNPFLYTGQQYDEESGLYFLRARYYQPAAGRFLERDPVGYAAGSNLYSYVGNDPENSVDPSGQDPPPSSWSSQGIYDVLIRYGYKPQADYLRASIRLLPGKGSAFGLRSAIFIPSQYSNTDAAITVLHELVHTRQRANGNYVSDPNDMAGIRRNEEPAYREAFGLYKKIRDQNPDYRHPSDTVDPSEPPHHGVPTPKTGPYDDLYRGDEPDFQQYLDWLVAPHSTK